MHHSSRTRTLLVIATSMVVSWFASVAGAQSHRGNRAGRSSQGGHQASAISSRPAPRPSPRRQAPQSRSRVVPPGGLGSAANVRPGFYQQLNAPRHRGGHRGGHHGGHQNQPAPVYVYPTYFPETYYPSAPAYSEPAPQAAPAPVQPQIYVVTPPVIAPPVHVTPVPAAPAAPPAPRSTEPGEVKFSVRPADAEVYLDDDYLGTGAELAALEEVARFPPGVHVLEVTHPDHRPQRLVFGVSDSDPAHVMIDLSIDRVGRRTRVK